MGQEAKTAVEAIKIDDTACCRENMFDCDEAQNMNSGIKIMMHVRKMFDFVVGERPLEKKLSQ